MSEQGQIQYEIREAAHRLRQRLPATEKPLDDSHDIWDWF